MGITHDVGAPNVPVQQLRLLRRLTIQCPVTGRPSDTGFELTELPSLAGSTQWLLDCLECGQDHEWRVEDLSLEGFGTAGNQWNQTQAPIGRT